MDQADVLRYALDVFDTQGLTYMVVGSLASGVFGEARLTNDIDIVVDLRSDQVEPLCRAYPAPEFYVSLPAARAAVARGGQFNVIHPTSGNKIDLMVARGDAWGREQVARRREEVILPDRRGYVASPEDVILAKMLYYREGQHEKHLRDIASMLRISGDQIDQQYIRDWASRLDLSDVWQAVLMRLGQA